MFNKGYSNLELFEIFVGMIQMLDYQQTMNQVDNNELEIKLEEQNNVYFKSILENQKIIINQNKKILEKISDKEKED